MSDVLKIDLVRLGREAAESVAGPEAVRDVRAEPDVDWTDQLTYEFLFVIDRSLVPPAFKPGEMRIRLNREIRDRLLALGDETYPHLRIMTPEEWGLRALA